MIRPATPADARAIGELHLRAWWRAYADFVDASHLYAHDADEREAHWRARLGDPAATTLVAEVAGGVVGFCTVEGDELDLLYIDPAAQGAGVGTALLAAGEEALRTAGHRDVHLKVFEANGHARAFYEARGWVLEPGVLVPDDWGPMVRYRRTL